MDGRLGGMNSIKKKEVKIQNDLDSLGNWAHKQLVS